MWRSPRLHIGSAECPLGGARLDCLKNAVWAVPASLSRPENDAQGLYRKALRDFTASYVVLKDGSGG